MLRPYRSELTMLDSRGEGGGTGLGYSENPGASYDRGGPDSYGLGESGQAVAAPVTSRDLDDEIPF